MSPYLIFQLYQPNRRQAGAQILASLKDWFGEIYSFEIQEGPDHDWVICTTEGLDTRIVNEMKGFVAGYISGHRDSFEAAYKAMSKTRL